MGSIQLVVSLTPADVDVVLVDRAVEQKLSDIGNTSGLLDKDSIVDLVIVVDIGCLGDGGDGIDMGLAGGEDLDSALPDAIDLGQSTRGSMASSRSNIMDSSDGKSTGTNSNSTSSDDGCSSGRGNLAEPGATLGNNRLLLLDSLLLGDDLLGLLDLDLNIDLHINLLVDDDILLDVLKDNLLLSGGSGGGGFGGDGLVLSDNLLLTLNDGKSLLLLDDLFNLLNGLDGLVDLDLVGEALCSVVRRGSIISKIFLTQMRAHE